MIVIPEEALLGELYDLLYCNPDQCEGCSAQRQDEGDEEPWCGFKSVIRKAISYIKAREAEDYI